MSKELYIVDMGTIQDAQSALVGVHRLDSAGTSVFDKAPFLTYISSPGLVLVDEINRAPMAAQNMMFPCLDDRRYMPVDIAGEHEERNVPVHEECVFFGTANLGSEYAGTSQIDRAMLDRFFVIELDYLDEAHEIAILQKRTGVEIGPATSIVRVAAETRSQFIKQELSSAVSVRHTLQAASLVVDGFDLGKAMEATIMPLYEDGTGVSERSKVKSILAAY